MVGPFKFACPKCGSKGGHSITKLWHHAKPGDEAADLFFSCMCGKQLFGPSLKTEWDKQVATHQAAVEEERARLAAEAKRRAEEEAMRAAIERARREAEERARREAEERARREAEAEMRCAWPGCPNPHREGSKYCSRNCSNKNARLQYTQRKKVA